VLSIYIQNKLPDAAFHLEKALETWNNLGNKSDKAQVLADLVEYELTKEITPSTCPFEEVERLIGPDAGTGLVSPPASSPDPISGQIGGYRRRPEGSLTLQVW